MAGELSRLAELYRADESQEIGTAVEQGKPLKASLRVDDVSRFLEEAVTAEGKVSFGPLQIPLGMILSLFGRIVQGPRVIGGLHEHDGKLILSAQFVGSRRPYSWRVEPGAPLIGALADQRDERPRDMVTELACRIFTDLTLVGSTPWRATWTFSEGLAAHRETLHTDRNRKLNLRAAEKWFLETLAEDKTFDLASYNLGVVYTELGQRHAAAAAIAKAIDRDPMKWQPHYARAWQCHQAWLEDKDLAQLHSAVRHCDRVIELAPRTVRAYDLRAIALRELGDLGGAIACHERAVQRAWSMLCRAELNPNAATSERLVAQTRLAAQHCLLNLAADRLLEANACEGQRKERALRHCRRAVGQAIFLGDADGSPHFALGVLCRMRGDVPGTVDAFESACRIAPSNLLFRAHLAQSYAAQGKHEEMEAAAKRVLESPSDARNWPGSLEAIVAAYQAIGDEARAIRVFEMIGFFDVTYEGGKEQLEERLAELPEERAWERGRIALTLANLAETYSETAEWYEQAKAFFENEHSQEIRVTGLVADLADALSRSGRLEQALHQADRALELDPLSRYEREKVGDIYYLARDWEHARTAWEHALPLEPDKPDLHRKLGMCHYALGAARRDPAARLAALRQGVRYLGQAHELYGNEDRAGLGRTLYSLGRIHKDLGEHELAIPYLTEARMSPAASPLTTLYLAEAYLRNKAYDDAIDLFDQVIVECNSELESGQEKSTLVGPEPGEQFTLGAVLIWARWGKALTNAERDANFSSALDELGEAKAALPELPLDERPYVEAAINDCEGWLLLKEDRIDDAIAALERSVSCIADAEAYLHYALATERKALEAKAVTARRRWIRRTARLCQHARELDLSGDIATAADAVLARVARIDVSGVVGEVPGASADGAPLGPNGARDVAATVPLAREGS